MEDAPTPPSAAPELVSASPTSVGARLVNVFATPGEVFEEIKNRPVEATNWFLPLFLSALFGVICCMIIFSQDTILQQLRETQDRAMEKKLEKMSKEDQEKVREMAAQFTSPRVMKLFGSVGAAIVSITWLFFLGLLLWLLGTRLFAGHFSYMKAVEACALAGMINILGTAVATLLAVITGNMYATLGPSLLINDFDPANKVHSLLAAISVMSFWYIGVLALALARLSGASFGKAISCLFLPWIAIRLGLIFSGLGQSVGM